MSLGCKPSFKFNSRFSRQAILRLLIRSFDRKVVLAPSESDHRTREAQESHFGLLSSCPLNPSTFAPLSP
jgi:hypothetical protein